MNKFNHRYQAQGSLAVMVLVSLVITSIAVSVGRVAYNQYASLSNSIQEAESYLMADSGAELALLELYRDAEYAGGTITFPEGETQVEITDIDPETKSLRAISNQNNIRRELNVNFSLLIVEEEGEHYLTGYSSYTGDGIQVQGNSALLVGNLHTNDGILVQNGATLQGNAFGRSGTTQIYNNSQVIDNPNTVDEVEGNIESVDNANIYNNVYVEGSVTTRGSVNSNASVVIDGGVIVDPSLTIDSLAVPTLDFSVLEAAAEANGTKFQWNWEMANYIELNDRVSDASGDRYEISGVYYLDSNDTLRINGNIPYNITGALVSQDGNVDISPREDYTHNHLSNYPVIAAGDSVTMSNPNKNAEIDIFGVIWGTRDVELSHNNYEDSAGRAQGIIVTGAAWSGDSSRIRDKSAVIRDDNLINNVQGFDFSLGLSNWYDAAWGYRKPISINSTYISGYGQAHNDFPMLVSFTDPDLTTKAQADGDDIIFTAGDGLTVLDHEVERFNSSTGELIAWVKVPAIFSTSDTSVYMYYGNGSATNSENASGVWSEYVLVHHMEETTSGNTDLIDSSPAGNDSSFVSVENPNAPGIIGSAVKLDGNNDYIEFPDSSTLDLANDMTIEAWVRLDAVSSSTPTPISILRKPHGSSPGNAYLLELLNWNGLRFMQFESGGSIGSVAGGSVNTSGAWYKLSAVISGNDIRIYINDSDASGGSIAGPTLNGSGPLRLGASTSSSNFLDGVMDEVRISNFGRSRDWIFTAHNNERRPDLFSTLGGEQDEATFNVGGSGGGSTVTTVQINDLNSWSIE